MPVNTAPDLFVTYMNADHPRLSTNTARVLHLDSVHGVYLNEDTRAVDRELLPLASVNTLTLLGAELVGRAYGGGMLKLEPREADLLPVPTPRVVQAARVGLAQRRRSVREALSRGISWRRWPWWIRWCSASSWDYPRISTPSWSPPAP